ncbi:MFS transporter [Achromobacter mucicolens]|uniref:MFS transporter n=1 Tax=Achromobacter mucicolens TaxID=1389922 RepID=UPI0022F3F268|nr:MFS transporter [Achromobacter mucicolens]MDG9970496.1 MFS transporter [Achromobacter mucicolens]WBX90424.1 MFS transporter [Achromobacter mucicolens]
MTRVRLRPLFAIVAIVAVALNLRPALAAIGPLLDMIQGATGATNTQASLLTTLPVFVMGVCALAGARISGWLNERIGIALGVALVAVACAARYAGTQTYGLLLTAVLAGVGIALVQTLLPAFIKRNFAHDMGRVFGLYTTGIMAGAAVAAASAAGLAGSFGWPAALAFWSVPALLALPLWLKAAQGRADATSPLHRTARTAPRSFWRNLRAWELMLFFGIGTGAYTLVLAWLPPFYTSLGWEPSAAGFLLGGLTLAEVMAGLAVSAWIGRFADRRKPLAAVLTILICGLICLILAPLKLALLACLLLGIGIGALFPLSLIVAMDHLDDPAQAGMLAAFVQGGGYLIASFMPLLAGVLRDRFASLTEAWIVMLAGAVVLLALALRFSPASYRRIGAG